MKVKICDTQETMSRAAAGWIARHVAENPRSLVCLATGSTPARAYELLGARARKSPALFGQIRVLKLDEWAGLPANDPGSCETYLQQRVMQPWGIPQHRLAGFAADSTDLDGECRRIRDWLARHGPIDLCVLGLGVNGHLGFNEPGRTLAPFAHRAALSPATRAHGMVAHTNVKPKFGLTLGMAEILQARRIVLLVSGVHKREPLQRLLRGEIATEFPASLLSLHPQALILCDRDAAAFLEPANMTGRHQVPSPRDEGVGRGLGRGAGFDELREKRNLLSPALSYIRNGGEGEEARGAPRAVRRARQMNPTPATQLAP